MAITFVKRCWKHLKKQRIQESCACCLTKFVELLVVLPVVGWSIWEPALRSKQTRWYSLSGIARHPIRSQKNGAECAAGLSQIRGGPFAMNAIKPNEPVVILGSGLTAVDAAMSLADRGPASITLVSRNGFFASGTC